MVFNCIFSKIFVSTTALIKFWLKLAKFKSKEMMWITYFTLQFYFTNSFTYGFIIYIDIYVYIRVTLEIHLYNYLKISVSLKKNFYFVMIIHENISCTHVSTMLHFAPHQFVGHSASFWAQIRKSLKMTLKSEFLSYIKLFSILFFSVTI